MDKKIVFFDIDGTIYSYKKGIPEDTVVAIRQLKANGHIPVICTGRTKAIIYDEFLQVGFEHIIAGAGTYVECQGKEIYCQELDPDEARRLIAGFTRNGFIAIAEGKQYIYMNDDEFDLISPVEKFTGVYHKMLGDKCRSVYEQEIHISKISGGYTYKSNPQGIIDEFGDRYSMVNHDDVLIELIPSGISKADGIRLLIDELGIPRENTYAFGDSHNDLEMLRYVKYGVAMGNSDAEVLESVQYRTSDFDKGGIAKGLKTFGLI